MIRWWRTFNCVEVLLDDFLFCCRALLWDDTFGGHLFNQLQRVLPNFRFVRTLSTDSGYLLGILVGARQKDILNKEHGNRSTREQEALTLQLSAATELRRGRRKGSRIIFCPLRTLSKSTAKRLFIHRIAEQKDDDEPCRSDDIFITDNGFVNHSSTCADNELVLMSVNGNNWSGNYLLNCSDQHLSDGPI